jgi:hypothetical protein
MNKKILALAALSLASGISGAHYVPEPKLFKHCYINKYNDPKQQACTDYIKRK